MIIKSLSPEWKVWIWTNVVNGLGKENIFNVLLNHGFDYDLISKELEITPSNPLIQKRKDTQVALNETPSFTIQPLYKPLCDNSGVYRIETEFLEIYTIPNFLSGDECGELIEQMVGKLRQSTVVTNTSVEDVRTSSTCDMFLDNPIYKSVNDKIHSFMKLPHELGEIPQGQNYLVGQQFKEHGDYFDENYEPNKMGLSNLGQRTWTFMVYLNDVEEGGETYFTKIDRTFIPNTGTAVVWSNILRNGKPNEYAKHCGLPVTSGEKNIITKWFREGPKVTNSPQEITLTEII